MNAAHPPEFLLLGPLEVRRDGVPVALGAPKQQALLAVLLLNRGEVLSSDRLIDELWGERAPAAAAKSVQVYISGLRKALGADTLQTRGRGYMLDVDPSRVDLERFAGAVARGKGLLDAGDAREGAAALREALGMWRGRALEEFSGEEFAQVEIARLEELRLAALEERIEADLALGCHTDLVPELEGLVRRHPLRERLRGQLMLALYRCGRQADALEEYRGARHALVEELGLEPGRELQGLERAILAQEPALDAPVRARTRALKPDTRRRRAALSAGAALLLAAATAAAIVELTRSGSGELVSVAANSVAAIDPRTNRVVADVPVGAEPSSIAATRGAVWVLNADDRTVSKIDTTRASVQKTFAIGGEPTDLAVGGDAVWVGSGKPATASQIFGSILPVALTRVDPGSATLTSRVRLPRGESGLGGRSPGQRQIAVGPGVVWAVGADGSVSRIDPERDELVTRIRGVRAVSIALDGSDLWVAQDDNSVVRIDARSNAVDPPIALATFTLGGIATGAGAVWVTDPVAGTLWRIDPGPRPVTRTIAVGAGALSVAVGAGAVWVVNGLDSTLLRIEPQRNRVVERIPIAGTPREVTIGSGRVWVSVAAALTTAQPATGAPRGKIAGALPASICGAVTYGGEGSPDLLIASDLPLHNGPWESAAPGAQAIAFVLARHRFHAGRYSVGYQACDDSTQAAEGEDPGRCVSNAEAIAAAPKVIGIIGPFLSECAFELIPIANRAPGGPLAMLSFSNSNPGLTRPANRSFEELYPTGARNYARISPTDDYQAAALALTAHRLGLQRVFVLNGTAGEPYGSLLADSFAQASRQLGLTVTGRAAWGNGRSYSPLAARIRRTRPDGVLLSGVVLDDAGALVRRLRATLGPGVELLAPDGFSAIPYLWREAGAAARGMHVSVLGRPNSDLGGAGKRFVVAFAPTQPDGIVPSFTAPYAAQAAEILLDAIARSDGDRASVSRELLRTQVRDGILGTFRFDSNGDTTLNPITVLRVTNPGDGSPTGLASQAGSTVERVISPPARLLHIRK